MLLIIKSNIFTYKNFYYKKYENGHDTLRHLVFKVSCHAFTFGATILVPLFTQVRLHSTVYNHN